MQKKASLIIGVTLIVLGYTGTGRKPDDPGSRNGFILGFRLWPIFVVGAGLLFCLPPSSFRANAA